MISNQNAVNETDSAADYLQPTQSFVDGDYGGAYCVASLQQDFTDKLHFDPQKPQLLITLPQISCDSCQLTNIITRQKERWLIDNNHHHRRQ